MVSATPAQAGMALARPRFLFTLALVFSIFYIAFNQQERLDSVYHKIPSLRTNNGRSIAARSTTERLAIAEKNYQKSVKERHQTLEQMKFGTREFKPWHFYMNWWWYFQAAFTCPHEVERIGFYGDGGKWVCGISTIEERRDRKCVVYSLGVQGDSSFEAEIVDRTNCEIFAFDASVEDMAGAAKGHPRIHFNKVFIGSEDKVDENGKVWKTLKTIMKENNHDWIDIIKMDIEGSEYGAMDSLMASWDVLPFSQLEIELHLSGDMHFQNEASFPKFLTWFEKLENWHLRPFWSELNIIPYLYSAGKDGLFVCEFSFINTAGNHALIQD